MKIADISVKFPVFATMIIAFLVVVGVMSYFTLGLDIFPKVDFPTVTVTTSLKGASPEEIETQITKPIEEVINTISGIDELRSTTVEGVSHVFVTFLLEKNIDIAAQEVREKVATVVSQFPTDTDTPIIQKMDPDAAPVMAIVVSGKRSVREVTEIAKKKIKEPLETVNGVGSITMVGGREREIQVTVDTNRLNAYGIGIDQVARAIGAQNVEIPGGRVTYGEREAVLRTMGRLRSVEEFNDIIISNVNGVPIRLSQIGKVDDTFEEPRSTSRLDGENAVSLLVRRQSGTNTVKVIETIKSKMEALKSGMPSDIKMEVVRDRSRFIKKSYSEVMDHLIIGSLLASIVVLLFMKNWRSTLIAAVSIPASIIATFTAIKFFGFTLNNMTMLALAICTGIVIDDAIIVIENIFRYIEEKGFTPMEAARAATSEIGLAVMATTLSLVVIFLPVAFMPGLPGRFFFSFGITATVAIMVSLFVAFSLTPMLASRFLKSGGHKASSKESRFYSVIDKGYGFLLKWSLGHRFTMIVIGIAIFSSVFYIFPRVGKELVVDDDQSEYEIVIESPEGSSLAKTDQIFKGVEDEVRKLPGVVHVFTTIGAGDTGSVTNGSIYVAMSPIKERSFSQRDSMREARKLFKRYPELRASVQNVGMISGGGFKQTDVNLVLRGPDLSLLDRYSREIVDYSRTIPGIVDADTSIALRKPEVRVEIDRNRTSELGVGIDSLAMSLRTMVGGQEVTKYKEGDEQYKVVLRLMEDYRKDPAVISKLSVTSSSGSLVRLDNFVHVTEEKAPAQIDRQDREKQVTILANLEGMALGEAMGKLQKKIDSMNLPQEYTAVFSGRAKTMNQAVTGFAMAIVLSLIFIYMVLASQFNSFVHPFSIMASLPIALPFGLFSLLATGKTLNVYSMIGVLMLFGIIKKNSILQVDYTNTLREQGMPRDEAIITANHVRLRPILMTTISIVFGMLPIALGKGDGSASRASMAMVMVGGQTLSLLITLLMTPVVYSLFDDLINMKWRFFRMRPTLIKSLFIPILIFSLQANTAFAADRRTVSLDECIDIALKNHPSIKASEKGVDVAKEQYKETLSTYYPKISLDASYTRSEVKTFTFTPGDTDSYSTALNLNQKIYDFGRTGGTVETARFRVDEIGSNLTKNRLDVIFGVKGAYFSVFKAMGLMRVQEAALNLAESHLRQAKGFYEAGAKAKFDVTNAEVQLNVAKLNLIKARNAFSTAMALLKNRMGVENRYPLDIDVASLKVQAAVNLDEGVRDALKRRPEMLAIEAGIKEGEGALKTSKGGYYPNLNASASYGYYDQYPVDQGENLFQEKNQRWNVGLSLNIPLFEGFLTRAKVSESTANVDNLKAQREVVSNNIVLDVTQAYLDLQDAAASIDVAESGLKKAKENLDIANGRYEAGVGTIIEVTDAQSSHTAAETDLVNARYDTATARAKFDRAVGLP